MLDATPRIEFGDATPAAEIPLYAATVRSGHATVFTVEGDRVRIAP